MIKGSYVGILNAVMSPTAYMQIPLRKCMVNLLFDIMTNDVLKVHPKTRSSYCMYRRKELRLHI